MGDLAHGRACQGLHSSTTDARALLVAFQFDHMLIRIGINFGNDLPYVPWRGHFQRDPRFEAVWPPQGRGFIWPRSDLLSPPSTTGEAEEPVPEPPTEAP